MTKNNETQVQPIAQVYNMEVVVCLPHSCIIGHSDEPNYITKQDAVLASFENFCKHFCNNYIFQLEDSNIGLDKEPNPHIQASVRLCTKKRPHELARLVHDQLADLIDDPWFKLGRVDCRPTLRFNADELNYKYVTKEETRIAGPITDHTFMMEQDFPNIDSLWQRMLTTYLRGPKHHREIINIYDPHGGCGKTIFQKWWYSTQKGCASTGLVDFSGSVGQVLAATVNQGPKQIYFINLPWKLNERTKQEKLDELGQAIESIKDGFLSTSYYGQGKTLCFKNPHVVIFSNIDVRILGLFAPDRVKVWEVLKTDRMSTDPSGSIDTNIKNDPNDPLEDKKFEEGDGGYSEAPKSLPKKIADSMTGDLKESAVEQQSQIPEKFS